MLLRIAGALRRPGAASALHLRPSTVVGGYASTRSAAVGQPQQRHSSSAAPWTRLAGEGGLLLRFGTGVDEAVNKQVLHCMAAVDAAAQWWVRNSFIPQPDSLTPT